MSLIWNTILPALWYCLLMACLWCSDPVWAGPTCESWKKKGGGGGTVGGGRSCGPVSQWLAPKLHGPINSSFQGRGRGKRFAFAFVLVSACLWQLNNEVDCLIPYCLISFLGSLLQSFFFMSCYMRCFSPPSWPWVPVFIDHSHPGCAVIGKTVTW